MQEPDDLLGARRRSLLLDVRLRHLQQQADDAGRGAARPPICQAGGLRGAVTSRRIDESAELGRCGPSAGAGELLAEVDREQDKRTDLTLSDDVTKLESLDIDLPLHSPTDGRAPGARLDAADT